jgi:NTP pyrophosphatase (non-canonical NTP hydrolase)
MVIMHSGRDASQTTPLTTTPSEITEALRVVNASCLAPGVWSALLTTGKTLLITDPTRMDVFAAAGAIADWLDEHNGRDRAELAARILKVTEEAGEAGAAWIGATGQNPRKGATHTYDDVCAELADVAMAALVAIDSLNGDPAAELARVAGRALARIEVSTDADR